MIKKIISIAFLVGTIPFGIVAMCYGRIVSSVLTLLVNMYYTSREVKIGLFELIKDLMPVLSLSLFMFLAIKLAICRIESSYIQLLVGISVGALIYGGGTYMLKIKEIKYISELSKKIKLWN